MTAVVRPLYIEQGATFTMGFVWCRGSEPPTDPPTAGTPYDLTGCVARMQVRKSQQSTILVDATSDGGSPTIFLGSTGTPDVFDLTNGRIDVILPATVTNLINVKTAKYDLEMVMAEKLPDGSDDIRRLMQGPVSTDPNITQTVDDPVEGY